MSVSNAGPLHTLLLPSKCSADPRGCTPPGVQHYMRLCYWDATIGTVGASPSEYQPAEGVECIFPNCKEYLASQNEYENVKWWAFTNKLTNGPHLECPLILPGARPSLSSGQTELRLQDTCWRAQFLNTWHGVCIGPSVDGVSGLYLNLGIFGKPPLFSDRELGEVGWQDMRSRNSQHATCVLDLVHVSSNLSPPTDLNLQRQKYERTRNSRDCASDPKHSTPHQSNRSCNKRCMLRSDLCAELILKAQFRQRTFQRVSSSFWKSFGRM
jgi:hypothetical protein